LKEWGIAIIGKGGGLFGSGAVTGTTQLTTLSGTTTVGSALELGTEAVLGAVEKAALPAMAVATAVDSRGSHVLRSCIPRQWCACGGYSATAGEKSRKALLGVITFACGILGLILFRWTPTTGRGIFIYAALFAVLIVVAIVLSPRKGGGYWPHKPEDH
jgi:hypothetical protein